MSDDLRWITGTLQVSGIDSFSVEDPLASLPDAPDDLTLRRTWPGATEHGWVRFTEIGPNRWAFHTVLPRRWGDLGVTRHGLFANGWWTPLVRSADGLEQQHWVVEIQAPEDAVIVLGGVVGRGTVSWSGEGDRASLAVVRRAQITPLAEGVPLVSRGRPPKALVTALDAGLEGLGYRGWRGAIVQAPLRRRLTRHGPGVAYVSDRAMRVIPRRVHRPALVQGVASGLLSIPDRQQAELIAAGLAQPWVAGLSGPSARGMLHAFAWNPIVYAILYDRRMPFVSDIFEEVHPGDPLRDDLAEVFAPITHGAVVAAQLDADLGPGTAAALAQGFVRLGAVVPNVADIPIGWLDRWRAPYPEQDLRLEVRPDGIQIQRIVAEDAPAEAIPYQIDQALAVWHAPAGPASTLIPLASPAQRVQLDPNGIVQQTHSVGDRWPSAWSATAAAWLDALNLRRGYVEGQAVVWLRPRPTAPTVLSADVWTTQADSLGAGVGVARYLGPRVDGLTRRHRLGLGLNLSLPNPDFGAVPDQAVALGTSASWRWRTPVDDNFPLSGSYAGLSLGAGALTDGSLGWWRSVASGSQLISPHPRLVLGLRGRAGLARSPLPHRQLDLGGPSALRSLPQGQVLGQAQAVGWSELRWAALRDLNIPFGLGWASELQLSAGWESGWSRNQGAEVVVHGATAGVGVVGDVFGAEPVLMGVTAGWALAASGIDLTPSPLPEIYLRWWQEF